MAGASSQAVGTLVRRDEIVGPAGYLWSITRQ